MGTISQLKPDQKNARAHNPRNIGMIVNALHEVGAARSIVIDEDGNILAGNATIEAAAEAGIENLQVVDVDGETIVAVRRTGLTPEQKKRLAYFDNRAADVAEWSAEQILEDLASGFNLDDMFTEAELTDFGWEPDKAEDPGAQMDKADELQEKWGVKRGDLFEIPSLSVEGKCHRILCGDSTDAADVEKLMGGELADMVFADPPFNVGYDYGDSYDDNRDDYPDFTRLWIARASDVMPTGWLFVMNITKNIELTLCSLSEVAEFANLIVWPHGTGAIPSNRFALAWQAIMVYRKGNAVFDAHADFRESVISDERGGGLDPHGRVVDIWDDIKPVTAGSRASQEALLEKTQGAKVHHAQMPIALPERAMKFCGKVGSRTYDPFLGSGTTIVACEQTGRIGYGMEIAEKYCSVTLERLTDMGMEPQLSE